MSEEEFEELYGNTPFKNIEKIKIHIKENYISKDKIKTKRHQYKKLLSSCNRAKDIDRIKALNERILFCDELLEE